MPWPATHILVSDKFFPRYFSHLNRKEFLLGNCFPDIRYPAKINRKRTHFKNVPLSEIQSQTSFHAGVLFHTIVDGFWDKHVLGDHSSLFSTLPHNQGMIHTMKILQDKYIYSNHNGWGEISGFFENIHPEACTYGANEFIVQGWHSMLAGYLSKPPTIDDLEMLKISLPPDLLRTIKEYYLKYQENTQLISVMRGFYDAVDPLMEQLEQTA